MPQGPVAIRQGCARGQGGDEPGLAGQVGGRRAIAGKAPWQEPSIAQRKHFTIMQDHRAIRQVCEIRQWRIAVAIPQAFTVQHGVDGVSAALCGKARRKIIGRRAAAFKAGTMAGGQRCHFIKKEQFRVAVSPDLALAALEFTQANDPAPRRPAP